MEFAFPSNFAFCCVLHLTYLFFGIRAETNQIRHNFDRMYQALSQYDFNDSHCPESYKIFAMQETI